MKTGWKTLGVLAAAASLVAGVASPASAGARIGWAATWSASVQAPVAGLIGPNWSEDGFANQSVRQVVRVSAGGAAVRLRLSTAYDKTPLRLAGATVGLAGAGAEVKPGTLRPVTFGHAASGVFAPGREWQSDPVALPVGPLDRLAVTFYFAEPTGPSTFHAFATATSYRAAGDHRFDRGAGAFGETTSSWYYLAGVDVLGVARPHSVVAFGDSITDGAGATENADNRYPDELAERLAAARRPVGVVNAGIGGNRVLNDSTCFGEKATARFQRDALDQPGVRTVIVLEGINDIHSGGVDFPCFLPNPVITARQLIDGHRALIKAAHREGVRMVGATILPYKGSAFFTEAGEKTRDEVNAWIRTSGEYDAVVDLERATVDPADGDKLNPAYDSGDALHPNDAGYKVMAAAVDLGRL
ncbi:SGNH/GDSL hydrolase family protein [Amycolatopsis sp. cg5]|uniref:SGNH/GDSL hydrolase family protein n=1 Tax=Amycolatopsis sp. cg5 TaxID=3238802 RepID=UPI003526AE84